jgi:hypothetical protein
MRDSTVPRNSAGAYAFGLTTQTCDFRTMIAHSGGLPGFDRAMAAGMGSGSSRWATSPTPDGRRPP